MHDGHRRYCSDQDQGSIYIELKNLKVVSVLGRGAKGVVFLVQTEESELLAVKVILRSLIENKKRRKKKSNGEDYKRICFEREVLSSFHHPLLPRLHGVLETDKVVGYAIDYCSGRDLNVLRKNQTEKMFSTDIIRFYAAEMVLALEYLHGLGIVYRDLKPENVLIQENGHLMLVDFDLSTKLAAAKSPETRQTPQTKTQITPKKKKFTLLFSRRDSGISPEYIPQLEADPLSASSMSEPDSAEKSNSFVGTEEYVAPEIVLGDGHDFSVDLWCLGVMLYEMLYGTTPFRGPARKDTFYRIVNKAPDLTGEPTPLRDLIRKLLEKNPNKRITIREIKGHDFFKAVDWDYILEMPRPPFIPDLTEVEDMDGNKDIDVESYVQGVFKVDEEEKINKYFEGGENKDLWANRPKQFHNDNFLIF